ncbi:MAG: hypothetical protein A2289_19650 [Deltaproteobacteria bacterium RIFOXYA12_FULL_58_15]|nr:MAG: hypothetical protein A2289_19650 [Deltaproteobacteria bacterium RIFOXYA12_FULL_58_15]OGR15287.1 MAG: hypothetical protein A2341_09900 [Deltaproteobacteria bacterium RIFOXYB12_FULL_58_9]
MLKKIMLLTSLAFAACASEEEEALLEEPIRTWVDTLPLPPNGKNMVVPDSGSNAALRVDTTPDEAGDIYGLFYCGNGSVEDRYYLLVSDDRGNTWRYLAATNDEPNVDLQHNRPWFSSITQDTETYAVHHAFYQINATSMRYNRIALAHNASGHVKGWSWKAQNQAGPTFNVAGSGAFYAKLDMREVIDGSGTHILMVSGIDRPSTEEQARLVVARTVAGERALAPVTSSDWVKVTNGTAGYDVLGAFWRNNDSDPDALVEFVNQDVQMGQHNVDHSWAQLPADKSLHFFFGPYYYNDGSNNGQIHRWRLNAMGADWSVDPNAIGVAVVSGNADNRPMMGHAVATANYVWLGYGSPETGLSFGRIDTTGVWTPAALPSPDPTPGANWYVSFAIGEDEARAWAVWAQPMGPTYQRSGYFNGSTWLTYDDTQAWRQNGLGDPVNWLHIAGWPTGAGVMSYAYDTYGADVQQHHIQIISSER